MDIFSDKNIKRIETQQFGVFKFQLGLDAAEVAIILQRVQDAQARFRVSPLSSVATQLEEEVVVRSVFGTNTIEGGELSEQETEHALLLSPEQIQNREQKRALNIKNAYDFIRRIAITEHWQPTVDNVLEIHRFIYDGLDEDDTENSGILRDNPDGVVTRVGNDAHGGIYKPPQNGHDIRLLLTELLAWNKSLAAEGVSALIRAPLVHLYFEVIHPFWDGNGRVGRVLEAGILYADGFRYAPFAQASYYLQNIDHYFALFNACRKAAKKKHDHPNAEFVSFFLKGMLETINTLHDRVNGMINIILFKAEVKLLLDRKLINDRQYIIVNTLIDRGVPSTLNEVKHAIWYLSLYRQLTDKTRTRDMKQLIDMNVLATDNSGRLLPSFVDIASL